ncbi:MAG TPA: ribonuclease III [Burkholderiaceae bacterium]|nr:ribonuclease III [Burkholderiaceae bacterium]HMZ01324.1 ribonuclease III [Burkholderiaceae bacterium]HNB44173.1 ribonuclease III [Burkholderiaceae bacterium]HNG79886.1 ribonuclease III [Burkholderiaceae bacterium]
MSSNLPVDSLQQRIGHSFRDRRLLVRALTHRSYGSDHNERLEFLGDAVLNLAVSDLLFDQYDDSPEGDLTRVRAHLVRQDMLHRIALSLQLPSVLRMSEGEARGGGAQRPSILADAMEAIIGAVYRDAGFDAAQALVRRLFEPLVSETATQAWAKDAKTQLQEWLQARRQSVPDYRIEATRGRAHDQTFVVVCSVAGFGVEAQGEGRSRRAAEQEAARLVLARLNELPE